MRLLSTLSLFLLLTLFIFSTSTLFPTHLHAQNGPDLELDTTFYVIPENAIALTQLFSPQFFAVNVHNSGDEMASEVRVSCRITDLTLGEEIYFVDKSYGELLPGESIENDVLNEEAFELPLINFFSQRDYLGEYVVTTTSNDSNPLNDTITFEFSSDFRNFAKESGRTGGIRLSGTENYVGNCFYIPQGYTFEVEDLAFMVDNADEIVAGVGSVVVLLYESVGDQNGDGFIDSLEYGQSPIYFNEYVFDGTENQNFVRFPIDLDGQLLELVGGKYYLIVLSYVGEDEEDTLVISVSEEYNYEATTVITAQTALPQYTNITFFRDSLNQDIRPRYTINGLGANVTPLIRLKPFFIDDRTQENSLPPDYKITIAPNPAGEQFMILFDFPEQTKASMSLFSQEGRLIKTYPTGNIYYNTITETCQGLPNGIYTLQIVTEKGNASRSILVQH